MPVVNCFDFSTSLSLMLKLTVSSKLSYSQESSGIVSSPKSNYRVNKNQLLFLILSHSYAVHAVPNNLKANFNIYISRSLLLHRAYCYIYFIQTNSCTLLKTHLHCEKHISYFGIKSWNHSNANIILQTTYSHIPNKQLDDANKQRSSNSTKHGKRPPEDGQIIVTETCRGFNDVIYKLF
jgi:hypothetical protein